MIKLKEIGGKIDNIHRNLYYDFSNHEDGTVILSHFGGFSMHLTNSLSEGLESFMQRKRFSITIVKRMFTIMIEGLQNICLHGVKSDTGQQLGHVMIREKGDLYSVSLGNFIDKSKKSTFSEYLENLNSMNQFELKEHYIKTLSDSIIAKNEDVGLGFITIALKSKSKISYQFIDYEGEVCYFEMRVNLA